MELEIKNGKFWILENKSDQNNIERYAYDDEKSAIGRIRVLLKSIDVQHLFLSTIDISGKEWNISGVQWSTIAMGLVREESGDSDKK